MLDVATKKLNLDAIFGEWPAHDILHDFLRDAVLRAFTPWLKPGRTLELGAGSGIFSNKLLAICEAVDSVEGSKVLCTRLREKNNPRHAIIHSLFEEFRPVRRYDNVIASFVNEHMDDVSIIYRIAREALLPGGILFIIVPNNMALSRQLAKAMGIMKQVSDLTAGDLHMGHCRTYNLSELQQEVSTNNFNIEQTGGLLLKPFADFQMKYLLDQNILSPAHLEGLEKLGQTYPDLCMSIYAVAKPV